MNKNGSLNSRLTGMENATNITRFKCCCDTGAVNVGQNRFQLIVSAILFRAFLKVC